MHTRGLSIERQSLLVKIFAHLISLSLSNGTGGTGFDWFFLFPCTRHSWMWHTRRNKWCSSCDSQRKCNLQLKHGFWKPRCGSSWRPCDDWRQQRVSWRCHGSPAPTTPALQSYERRKGVKKDGWQCLGSALSVHPVPQNY